MSFKDPIVLLALILIPILWLVYLTFQRRRARFAVRFTNLDLLANVVQRTPNWRRHVPPALYLLALIALVVAMARPERTVQVPREQASVVLTTDVSRSMLSRDVEPSRIKAAQSAGRSFLTKVPKNFQVGLVAFSGSAQLLAPPTTDRVLVREAINSLVPIGGTAMGDGLDLSLRALRPGRAGAGALDDGSRPAAPLRGKQRPAAILLLSDGASTTGVYKPDEVAQRAKALKVPINTVALGTDDGTIEQPQPDGSVLLQRVPPDREALKKIARISGGKYFEAPDSGKLDSIYKDLGSQLGYVKEKREMTWIWAGAGLALILAGGVAAMFWFSRFP